MKSKITQLVTLLTIALVPMKTFAVQATIGNNQVGSVFTDLLSFVKTVLGQLPAIVTAVLIILFGWNLIQFLMKKENIEESDKFKKAMINSLIALFLWFVLVSLITVVAGTFGLRTGEDVGPNQITNIKWN